MSSISGTASRITGGKFANGAVTAAYGFIFNQFLHDAVGLIRLAQQGRVNQLKQEAEYKRQYEEGKKYTLVAEAQGSVYKYSASLNLADGFVEQTGFATGSGWSVNMGVDYKINTWNDSLFSVNDSGTLSVSVVAPYGGFVGVSTEFSDGKGANVLNLRFIPSKPNVGVSYMVKVHGKSD